MTANPVSTSKAPLSLVIVFANEDIASAKELAKRLRFLEKERVSHVWHRGMIAPGGRLAEAEERAQRADVVVPLVSADLNAAELRDMEIAMERCSQGKARILPVRLRAAAWPRELRGLQPLPAGDRAVMQYPRHDDGWDAVVSEIESALTVSSQAGGASPAPWSPTPSPLTPRTAFASPSHDLVDGKRLEAIAEALVDAFPEVSRLKGMLRYRANRRLDQITTADGLDAKVLQLLEDAESKGWLGDLLLAARESNPGNGKLARVAETFVGIPTVATAGELQQLVDRARPFVDAEAYYSRLGKAIAATCRVEVNLGDDTRELGTGFLVGPDLVMTNYHVVEALVKGEAQYQSVVLRFDYRRRASGAPQDKGTEYFLAPEWLVDSSPYSRFDLSPHTDLGIPGDEELDYALLRVDGTPGLDSVGRLALDPGPRGWLTPERNVTPTGNEPLLILQHPNGVPLKLDVHNFLESRGPRLRYTVNTEHGSSGSPVFDGRLRLIALHHSGDARVKPAFNEGIPFGAIWRLLDRRSFGKLLGQPVPVSI